MPKVKNKNLKKSSGRWVSRDINDQFITQRKLLGYRSRSSFKLIEINKKFKFLKNRIDLLDLGSSPGGWSQVAAEKISYGKILAVDLLPMPNVNGVKFIIGDFLNENVKNKILIFFKAKIDVVISDMASNTTGNKEIDSFRTGELCLNAMDFSIRILKKNCYFISKIFMGSSFREIDSKAKKLFKKVIKFKPTSSRKESSELYLICKDIRN